MNPAVPRVPAVLMVVASLAGMASTAIQLLDRIAIAEQPSTDLVCDINATLSCGSVIIAWQSSVFGVPNALIGLAVFAVFASASLGMLTGSKPSLAYLRTLAGLAAFMLGFTLWFLYQSAVVIGALCLYCTVIGTAVVVITFSCLRLWHASGGLRAESGPAGVVRGFVETGDDRWFFLGLWAAVAVAMGLALTA